jgi:geranylgeranyl diphosphate synthase type II
MPSLGKNNLSRFNTEYNKRVELINTSLEVYLPEKAGPEENLFKAMRYSLLAGGKRLRPVLSLAVCDLMVGNPSDVMPFACAIEMIHTYSLIHDDLPAMDNDDYRRGRLTNHKVYGEALAILAGDGLLNYAVELMVEFTVKKACEYEKCLNALKIISNASGIKGMIEGQVVDMEAEAGIISAENLDYMHSCKTGAIIKAAVLSSAVLCGAAEEEISALSRYAENIGLAFQIKDDILDVTGDPKLLGKKTLSDEANQKTTYVTLYGIEESKKRLEKIIEQAVSALDLFKDKAWFLKELALYIINREK